MRSSPDPALPLAFILGLVTLVGSAGLVSAQEAATSPAPFLAEAASHPVAERDANLGERRTERAAERDAWHAWRLDRLTTRVALQRCLRAARVELQAAPPGELTREERRTAWHEARTAWHEARVACWESALARPKPDAADPSASAGGVVRTSLGLASPGSAPGEELGLWRYDVAPGAQLPAHTHPGWQLARIVAGELEYTVLEGEGMVLRADGSSEPMGPGTYVLATGDGVIENPALVHEAANRGRQPVVIVSATLFEAGQPVASLVDASPSPAPLLEASPAASPTAG